MKRLIIGCGFLGRPVAEAWAAAGDQVYATTRKTGRFSELKNVGIEPVRADITDPMTLGDLPAVDSVVIAVGMDRSVYSDVRAVYVEGLKNVLMHLPTSIKHLIYISSTGVYGNFDGSWIDEQAVTQPTREGGKACLEAESILRDSPFADRTTILRMAGLYGNSRIPMLETISKKRWDKLSPAGFLNLVHVADCVQIIQAITEAPNTSGQQPSRPVMGQTFLIGDGNPVPRKEYYESLAELTNVGPIDWRSNAGSAANPPPRGGNNKRISNKKITQTINYQFLYPNFRAGLKQAFDFRSVAEKSLKS